VPSPARPAGTRRPPGWWLLRPAEPLGRARRLLLGVTTTALMLAPVLVAFAPAALALVLGRVPAA
jgi:hypothetical protein